MSGTISQGQGSTAALPFSGGYFPPEGSRVLTAVYSWTATRHQYEEDLSYYISEGLMTTIQSLWVDNSQSQFPVTIQILGSNQVIVVPSISQGMYPVFFPGSARFKIAGVESLGELFTANPINNASTRLCFLNIPQSATLPELSSNKAFIYTQSVSNISAGSFALITPTSNDVRFLYYNLRFDFWFTTGPTAPANLNFHLYDNASGNIIQWWTFSFAAADTTVKSINIVLPGVFEIAPQSPLFMNVAAFPTGASNGNYNSNMTFTVIPVIF